MNNNPPQQVCIRKQQRRHTGCKCRSAGSEYHRVDGAAGAAAAANDEDEDEDDAEDALSSSNDGTFFINSAAWNSNGLAACPSHSA